MRLAFRLGWSRAAERRRRPDARQVAIACRGRTCTGITAGPFFGNAVATLRFDGRTAALTIETSEDVGDEGPLRRILAQT